MDTKSSSSQLLLGSSGPSSPSSSSTSSTSAIAVQSTSEVTSSSAQKSSTKSCPPTNSLNSVPIGMHNIGQIRLLTGHRPSEQITSTTTSPSSSMAIGDNCGQQMLPSNPLLTGGGSHSLASSTYSTDSITDTSYRPVTQVKLQFLVLGSESVGKTSILSRLQGQYSPVAYHRSTGPDLHRLKCGQIEAIDIGGQQSCIPIARAYCDLVNAYLVVFDIGSAESFLYARYWLDYLQGKHQQQKSPTTSAAVQSPSSKRTSRSITPITPPTILLIGNKNDLKESKRKVSKNLAHNLALVHDADYLELSARYDLSLEQILEHLERRFQANQSTNSINEH